MKDASFRDKIRRVLIHNFEAIRIIAAIVIAFVVITVIVLTFSNDAGKVCYWFLLGPLTSLRRFGGVIELGIPFIFCGLSVTMMLAVDKFNLSSDGIFYVGMAFCSVFVLKCSLGAGLTALAAILLCSAAGGLIALIPALLNVKYSANVVVCALMLNYVLQYIGRYILLYVVKDPTLTYNGSYVFSTDGTLPNILPGTRVHAGLFLAVAAVIFIYVLLYKTKLGYAIRITGQNGAFAKYCGISVVSTVLISQMIGGMLAGMGGAIEVMGIYKQFTIDALLGYGFDGLLIAVLGKKNPVGVAVAALALAYLRQGAALVNSYTDIPLELVQVLQGLVVIFCAAEMLLSGVKNKMIVKDSKIREGRSA